MHALSSMRPAMDELFCQTEEWTITVPDRSGSRSTRIKTACNEARHGTAFAQFRGTARYWGLNTCHARPELLPWAAYPYVCATNRATSEPWAPSPALAGRLALEIVPHKGWPVSLAREQAVRHRYSPFAEHLYTILDNYIFVFLCNLQQCVSQQANPYMMRRNRRRANPFPRIHERSA